MADISLIQDDPLDDCDEGVFEQGDGFSGKQVGGESLSPLVQVQEYALSDNVIDRELVPKVLQEIMKNEPPEAIANDLPEIMKLVSKLAIEDENSTVRNYIFEQVPNLALVAYDCAGRAPALNNIVGDYLLPLVVQKLGDNDNQVRKIAQSTLFLLIENGLVNKHQAELQICPAILELSNSESLMDYHTGTVTLMSKLAPFLGSELTERMFLIRFSELCSNDMFYVRKDCASHFGDFCAVVGTVAYEQTLLPCYLSLCSDDIWGVRKACAEVATCVSCPCPSAIRWSILAPAFAKLLQDQSRWVRMSAFQTLGPFISTFADPTIISLAYNSLGELVVVNNEGAEFRINITCPGSISSLLFQFQERFNQMDEVQDSQKNNEDYVKHLLSDLSYSDEIEIDNVSLELVINKDECEEEDNRSEFITDFCNTESKQSALLENSASSDANPIFPDIFGNVLNISNSDKDIDLNVDSLCSFDTLEDSLVLNTQNLTLTSNSNNHIDKSDISIGYCDKSDEISNGVADICNIDIFRKEHNYIKEYSNKYNVVKKTSSGCLELEQYNSFNYWYISPEMPLPLNEIGDLQDNTSESVTENQQPFIVMEHCSVLPQAKLNRSKNKSSTPSQECSINKVQQCEEQEKSTELPQHIVPQFLIDHFISMIDPNLADSTDKDLAYHCAYSLPAVALTLGRSNWHLLKDTVEFLAGNIHYKVRRAVASCLHELANILGSEMATSCLTPIFNEFIKDLDEVRIEVLKHLSHFLELINQPERNLYLPKLVEFLPAKNMNSANWRFRKELAEQLIDAMPLFRPNDATKHISNIAQELMCDKVAAVRQSAIVLITELVCYTSNEQKLASNLLIKLAERFAHSTNWKRRQTFCLFCENYLFDTVHLELFASDVMPHLLDLSWDPVANVRLVVARTISQQIAARGYFFDVHSQHYDSIHSVLRHLQSDKDSDVRQSAVINKVNVFH